jgi:hypothetical protein
MLEWCACATYALPDTHQQRTHSVQQKETVETTANKWDVSKFERTIWDRKMCARADSGFTSDGVQIDAAQELLLPSPQALVILCISRNARDTINSNFGTLLQSIRVIRSTS